MQTFLTERQRAEIIKQDAKFWRGCCCCLTPLFVICMLMSVIGYLVYQSVNSPTEDKIEAEITSPDGAYAAVIVSRSSGTFAPDEGGSGRVLLRRVSEKFKPDGEGHINLNPVFWDVDTYDLSIKWKDSRTLLIIQNGCWRGEAGKEQFETNWLDVKINYSLCQRTR